MEWSEAPVSPVKISKRGVSKFSLNLRQDSLSNPFVDG